ncbi:hypothetical protein [Oceanidesulfovibrio marinus]|uniref:GIY-YIG domain-containing protein n=1 Tax=Oceanidesulfovibrio marinus TaxID=370038 RepID=A0ABX6NE04_9BACT|nr:hypothetical protein [Oceanidesulfovibrio marinus]QJT08835.1 hypothetical protein E8L03_07795 [Oceanidesulfovibrio marinus]
MYDNILENLREERWQPLTYENIAYCSDFPGVYVITFLGSEGEKFSYKRTCYVGMTNRALRVRIRAFYKSATSRKSGHSGGRTCQRVLEQLDKFGSKKYQITKNDLLFIEIPFMLRHGEQEPFRTARIEYIEKLVQIKVMQATSGKGPLLNSACMRRSEIPTPEFKQRIATLLQ